MRYISQKKYPYVSTVDTYITQIGQTFTVFCLFHLVLLVKQKIKNDFEFYSFVINKRTSGVVVVPFQTTKPQWQLFKFDPDPLFVLSLEKTPHSLSKTFRWWQDFIQQDFTLKRLGYNTFEVMLSSISTPTLKQ